MRCLIDHANMVNLFWSEKCGCTYIKSLYNYYIRGVENRHPHTVEFGYELPFKDPDYKNILVVRNPYDRLVSGYFDKYVDGHFTCDLGKCTFEEFIDHFNNFKYEKIDYDHFSLQFSRAYDDVVFNKVYDIESFHDQEVVKEFVNEFTLKKHDFDLSQVISRHVYDHDHTNASRHRLNKKEAYSLPYEELCALKKEGYVPYYSCFYNEH